MTLPESFRHHDYSRLEMLGRHYRNVLRALVRLRVSRGQPIGNLASWTHAVAEIAAAVVGPDIEEEQVDGMCAWIGIKPSPTEISRATTKARAARLQQDFALMSGAVIGRLVDFTAEEKAAIAAWSKMKRVAIIPVDIDQARRERSRIRKEASRKAAGSTPRALSKAALARQLGVSRATLYRRGDATLSGSQPIGPQKPAKPALARETVSGSQPAGCDTFGLLAPLQGKGPETVSAGSKTTKGKRDERAA